MPAVDYCRHEFRPTDWLRDRKHSAQLSVDPWRSSERMPKVAFVQRIDERSVQGSVAQWRLGSRWTAPRRVQASENPVERVFEALANKWRHETSHISSTTKLIMHPSYQSIIGMGPTVVPLLLRRLQQRPEHWFWALSAITRHNPVKPEDAGSISKMTEAWLEWGRQRGQI